MKKYLPVLILGVLVLGGVGFYVMKKPVVVTDEKVMTSREEEGMEEDDTISGKLQDILKMGKSVKCTWKNADSEGTMWVKGEKFYMEGETAGEMGKVLSADGCVYMWGNAMEQGMKICMTEEDAEDIADSFDTGEFQNYGAASVPMGMEYKCMPAVITEARFNAPSDVEFVDFAQMFQGGFEGMEGMMPDMTEMPEGMDY